MKRLIDVLGLFAILAVAIITGAGALNYAEVTDGHIYTVFGIINIIAGVYCAYRWAKYREIL